MRKASKKPRREASLWMADFYAALAGLALAVIFFFPRLPVSTDLILPRRAFFFFFRAAIYFNQRPTLRTVVSWLAVILLFSSVAAALVYLYRRSDFSWRQWKSFGPREGFLRALVLIGGLYLLWRLARFALSLSLDLLQNVYFPPESLDWREPLILWAVFFAAASASLRTAAALWRWAGSKLLSARELAAGAAPAWLLLALSLSLYARAVTRYDAGHMSLDDAAGIPAQALDTRTVIVLSEKEGRPDYEIHPISAASPWAGYSAEGLETVEKYLSRLPTVFGRAALAYLYDGYAVRMDGERLRHALLRGHQAGDGLARMLLLENLAIAAPSAANRILLESLADEKAYRIGPRASARIAEVYSHFGIADQVQYWRRRASSGKGALPPGLLAPSEKEGALKTGVVRGVVHGGGRATVGLYARPDPYSPYALGPTQLVESVESDSRGGFEFRGLSAGEYFLAFSIDSLLPDEVRIRGHKGNIRLDPRHSVAALAPIEIRR